MDLDLVGDVNQAIRLLSLRHRARAAEVLAPLRLHPGQEVLLLELAKNGPVIQAQLSEALSVEPPSVTIMLRKLVESGHVRRTPSPTDKRASLVELTKSGKVLAVKVQEVWRALAEESVQGFPAKTVTQLIEMLNKVTENVDTRAPRPAR